MAKPSWLWICFWESATGLFREMQRRGHTIYVLPLAAHPPKGFKIIGEGKPISDRIEDALSLVTGGKIDFAVCDMIGHLPHTVNAAGMSFKTVGQIAQHFSKFIRGINVFPFAAAAEDLELERDDGASMAAAVGIKVPETHKFDTITEGIGFVMKDNRRWVFKPNDNRIFTFVPNDKDELLFYLDGVRKQVGDKVSFILQEFIDGVEVDIEGWFSNGEYLAGSANITLETKKFMTGDMGRSVGCATTLQKRVSEDSVLFKKALMPYFKLLRRWQYTGAFSTTVIVERKSKQPFYLENCSRMGYDAIYALMELYGLDPSALFLDVLKGTFRGFGSAFAYAAPVTIPPYPYEPLTKEEQKAVAKLCSAMSHYMFVWGEKRAKGMGAKVWWCDTEPTGDFIGPEPVYHAYGMNIASVSASHPTDPMKAQAAVENGIRALRGHSLQARMMDGAHKALSRFQTLKQWGIIITDERRETSHEEEQHAGDRRSHREHHDTGSAGDAAEH